jgi:hypothetical protein
MACPYKFFNQCVLWRLFVLVSVPVSLLVAAVGVYLGYCGWDLAVKVIIAMGTTTCVVWWLWIMKKAHDLATWWIELRENINAADNLLKSTKQDLQEIKQGL